jgi:hypothetical protein
MVYGTYYEGIVLMGARPDDLALWRSRGYVTDWEHGSALMAHFEPCQLDFTMPAAAAVPPPTFDVRIGERDFIANERLPSRTSEDGLAHFSLARAPCGEVTVRASWEEQVAGAKRATFCSNADKNGRIRATLTRASHEVVCSGRSEPN